MNIETQVSHLMFLCKKYLKISQFFGLICHAFRCPKTKKSLVILIFLYTRIYNYKPFTCQSYIWICLVAAMWCGWLMGAVLVNLGKRKLKNHHEYLSRFIQSYYRDLAKF